MTPDQNHLPPTAGQPTAPQAASMGRRLGARLVDFVIFMVVFGWAIYLVTMNFPIHLEGRTAGAFSPLGTLVYLVLWIGYEAVSVAVSGRTPGKMLLGLEVARASDGGAPGWGPAIIRGIIPPIGWVLCVLPAILVFVSPFFDSSGLRRGWHDKASGTVVTAA